MLIFTESIVGDELNGEVAVVVKGVTSCGLEQSGVKTTVKSNVSGTTAEVSGSM